MDEVIKKMRPRIKSSVADLVDGYRTPKELAHRDEVTRSAIYMRRRRFEQAAKTLLPRHEKRGRKPASASAA